MKTQCVGEELEFHPLEMAFSKRPIRWQTYQS